MREYVIRFVKISIYPSTWFRIALYLEKEREMWRSESQKNLQDVPSFSSSSSSSSDLRLNSALFPISSSLSIISASSLFSFFAFFFAFFSLALPSTSSSACRSNTLQLTASTSLANRTLSLLTSIRTLSPSWKGSRTIRVNSLDGIWTV